MEKYDVVIVGAGPAGAMAAKELAERDFNVLVIEKEIEVGYTNKSTAATPLDTFETFELPRSLGFEDISGYRLFGPTKSCIQNFTDVVGRTLMFRETKQFLIKKAIRMGVSIMLGTAVDGVIKKSGKVVGVSYNGFEGEGVVNADVVIDASGPRGVLATKLGLWKPEKSKEGVAFEYFMENAKPDKGDRGYYLDFFMGSEWAPGGYSWIFPATSTSVKAGICKLEASFRIKNEKSQKEYFKKLRETNSQIKDAEPFEIHQCTSYFTGGIKSAVLDNFIAIGDAAHRVNPLFGEGVRPAFYSAVFASQAIEEARKRNDFSKRNFGTKGGVETGKV